MQTQTTTLKKIAFLLGLTLLFSCTEETIVNNPPTVIPDQRPPLVEWVSVRVASNSDSTGEGRFGNRPYAVSDSVVLTLSATDSSGIDSLKLYINGFEHGKADSCPPYQPVTFLWNTLSDSDGTYSLEARAWDGAGNVGVSPALLLRVSNTTPPPPPDRTPPSIRIVSPEPSALIRDTLRLEFIATDEGGIDSLKVFFSGEVERVLAEQDDSLYVVNIDSWRWGNGRKIIEVRAWDGAGNVGVSDPVGVDIDNHRVIWVPDEYETIQGAINASVDGDTVRVRAGVYYEQLQFFDKNVSFVSESGPEETIIEGTGYFTGIWVTGGQDTTMLICGFTFSNAGDYPYDRYGAFFDGASPRIVNNILVGGVPNVDRRGIRIGQNNSIIRNNLFINLSIGIEIGHSWGSDFSNNMLINIQENGLWSLAATGQSLAPDYNLFWTVGHYDSSYFNYGPNNIKDQQPWFQDDTFQLEPGSPGMNHGRSDLLDPDGTISDIGVYGGPYAYPPPQ